MKTSWKTLINGYTNLIPHGVKSNLRSASRVHSVWLMRVANRTRQSKIRLFLVAGSVLLNHALAFRSEVAHPK